MAGESSSPVDAVNNRTYWVTSNFQQTHWTTKKLMFSGNISANQFISNRSKRSMNYHLSSQWRICGATWTADRHSGVHAPCGSLLLQVLSCHIPFLVSSVEDFKDHIPRETDMKVRRTTLESLALRITAAKLIRCVIPGGHERVRAVVSGRSALRDRPGAGRGSVLAEER